MAVTSSAARAAHSFIELRRLTLRLPDGRVLLDACTHTFGAGLTGLVGANGTGKSMLARAMAFAGDRPHAGHDKHPGDDAHGGDDTDTGTIAIAGRVHYVAQQAGDGDIGAGISTGAGIDGGVGGAAGIGVTGIGAGTGNLTVAQVGGLGDLLAASARMDAGQADDSDFDLLDGRWTALADFAAALQDCGLGRLKPTDSAAGLSGGELTRIALAGAFHSNADWLILDEPSNHLDRAGRCWLLAQLRAWPGNAIIVSHDRELLEAMDSIVALEGQQLHTYGGNYALYRSQRDTQQAAAAASLAHARTERRTALREQRERHDAVQSRAARNNRAGKEANMPAIVRGNLKSSAQAYAGRDTAQRTEARSALDEAVRDAAARLHAPSAVALLMPGTAVPPGRRVLAFDSAIPPWPAPHAVPPDAAATAACTRHAIPSDSAAAAATTAACTPHAEPGGKRHSSLDAASHLTLPRTLDFALTGPVRLAITGPNGCGKSTLLRMLSGELPPLAGSAKALVPFAWLDQHASTLPAGQSVLAALQALDSPLSEGTLRSHLALLGLGPVQATAPVAALSGGEKLKAALAAALWRKEPAQLLLLDEPTNHLDLRSTEALEQALRDYPGAMAIVSHDQRFLQALAPSHELKWTCGGWQLHER